MFVIGGESAWVWVFSTDSEHRGLGHGVEVKTSAVLDLLEQVMCLSLYLWDEEV
ncbi:MAG: hypothetical protein ACP5MD_11020 [Verrucomicrobiia bacterium]